MTEDEAKTKWCPMARVADTLEATAPAANRTAGPGEPESSPAWAHCIGSACMMWRLIKGPYDPDKPDEGHCGLAGKP